MGLLESIREAFEPTETSSRPRIVGAYWCDDCSARTPVYESPGKTDEEPPTCPDCDGSMRFERSPDSGDCSC